VDTETDGGGHDGVRHEWFPFAILMYVCGCVYAFVRMCVDAHVHVYTYVCMYMYESI